MDGSHHERLATLPSPGVQHSATQRPVEHPPVGRPDTAADVDRGRFAVCGPGRRTDLGVMLVAGVAHAFNDGQRQRRVGTPHVAGHLPLVGPPGAMGPQERPEGREEVTGPGIGGQPPGQAGHPAVEKCPELWVGPHHAAQLPEVEGRVGGIHPTQAAQEGQRTGGVAEAAPAHLAKHVQADARTAGDHQVDGEETAQHGEHLDRRGGQLLVGGRRHVGQAGPPPVHLQDPCVQVGKVRRRKDPPPVPEAAQRGPQVPIPTARDVGRR